MKVKFNDFIALIFGSLSFLSYVLYFVFANNGLYELIDVIFMGPIFAIIGLVVSIVRRKERFNHPILWLISLFLSIICLVIAILILIILITITNTMI